MITGVACPCSSRKVAPIALEYFVPSLKTWPISLPWLTASGAPQRGQGSPASASRRSWTCSSGKSRPGTTPVRWTSTALPPTTTPGIAATERSIASGILMPIGPRNPIGAPVAFSIRTWSAGAIDEASNARRTFASFAAQSIVTPNWSPRSEPAACFS